MLFEIDGLTVDNYPRVDVSSSTQPLNTLIACKLLGWRYELLTQPLIQLLRRDESYLSTQMKVMD